MLARYIELLSERVDGLGGDPNVIPPSFGGYLPGGRAPVAPSRRRRRVLSGKVCEVLFDCFGDFEGFILCTCEREHRIASHEPAVRGSS